jgi:hypothetical protein
MRHSFGLLGVNFIVEAGRKTVNEGGVRAVRSTGRSVKFAPMVYWPLLFSEVAPSGVAIAAEALKNRLIKWQALWGIMRSGGTSRVISTNRIDMVLILTAAGY